MYYSEMTRPVTSRFMGFDVREFLRQKNFQSRPTRTEEICINVILIQLPDLSDATFFLHIASSKILQTHLNYNCLNYFFLLRPLSALQVHHNAYH